MTFQVFDSITPNHDLNRTIGGIRLQSPKGPGLLGQNPALGGELNNGLGTNPVARSPSRRPLPECSNWPVSRASPLLSRSCPTLQVGG